MKNQSNPNYNQRDFYKAAPIYQPSPVMMNKMQNFSPSQSTISPSVWGRPFWFSLHNGALNYPDDADDEKKQMMINFILGLPIMLPCDACKNHAYEYIQSKKSMLHHVVQNSRNLFQFFWEFHNDVNKRTGKPTLSLEAVYNLYRTNPTSAL
jgi:hypothetical protein